MTTGRINQVANPSSTRGRIPRGTPEERRRAARATARRPTRGGEPDGLGRGRSVAWASAGGVAVAVVLGREAPMHTPLAHVVASLLGRGRRGFPRGLDRSARLGLDLGPVAWNGPFDARGIEFPTDGVRSVDNYEGPVQ